MSQLIYFTPASLDGWIAADTRSMNWSAPDEGVSTFINEVHLPIGTYLYGRRQYETMRVWQTPEVLPGLTPAMQGFGRIWQAAEKIVYSRSLGSVSTPRTRLEREFDPRAVRDLKARLPHDLTVGGPDLAGQAIRAGLVDEIQLLVVPVLLGGGIRVLPGDVRVRLELLDERRFGNGWVYLRYRSNSRNP